jgi:hypothetical protein
MCSSKILLVTRRILFILITMHAPHNDDTLKSIILQAYHDAYLSSHQQE